MTQFTAVKPEILLKTEISVTTTSLGITKNLSNQKNNRPLVYLSKKNYFGGHKLDLNSPLGLHQRVIRHFHRANNSTIHLYFFNAKFHLLGTCRSRLYLKESNFFFGSGPNRVDFKGSANKQRLIELKKY